MADSLLTLIANAWKYFVQDMSEAAILSKRLLGEGRVTLGELEVKEYLSNSEKKKAEEPVQKPAR